MYKYKTISLLLIFALLYSTVPSASSDAVTDRYISMALQGDLSGTWEWFSEGGVYSEETLDTELADRFRARFIDNSEVLAPATGDPLANAVIGTYRNYWSETLLRRRSLPEGLDLLKKDLREILPASGEPGPAGPAITPNVFARMADELERRGFHVLDTPAPPLRDLFLWREEETVNYKVRLTDRSQPVRVTFIKNVYSFGWKEFATLGLLSTTGWVEDDRLYCIDESYDRNSENFRISYLKHEGRHLADFKRFPALTSAELEYRAKLTELAFADRSSLRLLTDFVLKSADNPDSPHAYANFRVTRDMHQALYDEPFSDSAQIWQGITSSRINRAARRLLELDTRALAARRR